MPSWLTSIAWISLITGLVCAIFIVVDVCRWQGQRMTIMNVVWPVTALYAGPLAVWAYVRIGRRSSMRARREAEARGERPPDHDRPFLQSVGLGASHCGSGCSLGDLVAESLMILVPFSLFGSEIAASWTLDYVLAFIIGIAFQYFSIKPMTDKSPMQALGAALKADTLSLTSWQVGMYGWMAIAMFGIFGHTLDKTGPVFWFMMQIAMLAGFATAFPVNAWLIKRGIKEKM